jgi:FMN phosphatase YigB (HAD superfamily)
LWDTAGGYEASMQTCWINRGEEVKASEALDIKPDYAFDIIGKIKRAFIITDKTMKYADKMV